MRGLVGSGFLAALLLVSHEAAAAPRAHVVTIDKMKFGTLPGDLKAGDTILWVNRDIFRHTGTASDGSFNVDLPPGSKGKIFLRKAGSFDFACKYHPGMRGVLKVAK